MAALNIESFCNVTPYSACQNFGKSQARESAPSAGSIAGARVSQVLQQPWLPADKAALGAAETARYPPSSIRKHERESTATRHNQPTKTTAGFPSAPAQSSSTHNWISQRAAHPRFQRGHPALGGARLPKAKAVPTPGRRAQHLPILLRKASSPPAPFPDFIPAIPVHHCRPNRSKVSLLN